MANHPLDLELLIHDLLLLHFPISEVARKHALSMVQLQAALASPDAEAILTAHRQVATLRARVALDKALPEAVDRLVDAMHDETASPETRRKAAGALVRLHRSMNNPAANPKTPAPPHSHNPDPHPDRDPTTSVPSVTSVFKSPSPSAASAPSAISAFDLSTPSRSSRATQNEKRPHEAGAFVPFSTADPIRPPASSP